MCQTIPRSTGTRTYSWSGLTFRCLSPIGGRLYYVEIRYLVPTIRERFLNVNKKDLLKGRLSIFLQSPPILRHANKGFPEDWLKVVFGGDRQRNDW